MKKYIETKSKAPFDWHQVLSKNCKDMTQKEVKKLDKLSESWVTCACGNQCAIIPRAKSHDDGRIQGEPLDEKLANLGGDFHCIGVGEMADEMGNYFTTNEHDWADDKKTYLKNANRARLKAITILKRIEKRSAYLIRQEVSKAKEVLEHMGYSVKG